MDKKGAAIIGGIGIIGAALGVAYYATKPSITSPPVPISTTSTQTTTAVPVVPPVISLTASSTDVVQGIPITFSIGLTQNQEPIPDALVRLTGLGSPIVSTTSSLGVFKKTITIKTPGNYTVVASYKGTTYSTTSSLPITVGKDTSLYSVNLKASATGILEGESVKFVVTALNQYNSPLGGMNGTITINGATYGKFTANKKGSSTFTIGFDNIGNYYVKAVINDVSSNDFNIGVNYSYKLNLEVSTTGALSGTTSIQQQVGAFVYWMAQVTGAESGGHPAGIAVKFQPFSQTVNTGSTGVAVVRTTYTTAGTYSATAEAYSGSKAISSSTKATVVVYNNFKFNLSPISPTVNAGGTVTFNVGAINGINAIAVPYEAYVNGTLVKNGNTGTAGQSFNVTFPNAGTSDVMVKTTFAGKTYSQTATVTVAAQLSSYTCYYCECKQIRMPDGTYQSVCAAKSSYTRNSPCPENNSGGYSSASACCSANPCP